MKTWSSRHDPAFHSNECQIFCADENPPSALFSCFGVIDLPMSDLEQRGFERRDYSRRWLMSLWWVKNGIAIEPSFFRVCLRTRFGVNIL